MFGSLGSDGASTVSRKTDGFICRVEGAQIATLLDFACMRVEEISCTRKDGQYGDWDYRR